MGALGLDAFGQVRGMRSPNIRRWSKKVATPKCIAAGKWTRGLEPAAFWWLDFDPESYVVLFVVGK